MKSKYRNLLWLVPIAILVIAAVPSFQDFNTNQFGTAGNRVSIKTGVLVTNPVIRANGTLGTAGQALLSTGSGVGWSNVLSDGSTVLSLTISNLASTYQTSGSLTVTNPITNLSLTADTMLQADANKAISSVPNGTGVLTNDGAGGFSWVSLQPFVASLVVWPVQGSNTVLTTNGMAVTVNALTDTNVVQAIAAEAVDMSAYQPGDAGLTNFANLADGAGVLTNDGTGGFSWVPIPAGIAGSDVLTMINTNAVWTNYNRFIWPSDGPQPSYSGAGPRLWLDTNGSLYAGPHIFQYGPTVNEVNVMAVSLVASNDPPLVSVTGAILDSEDWNYNADYAISSRASVFGGTNGNVMTSMNLYASTINSKTAQFYIYLEPDAVITSGVEMVLKSQSTNLFRVDRSAMTSSVPVIVNQLISGAGFKDASLNEGSIVGVGASGRLINTNIVQMVENNTFTNVTITNLTVQNLTVNNSITVVSNISAKTVNVENIYVTNGTVLKEHTWTGATNQLYVGSTNRYTYTAYTPCAVTNLVQLISGFGNSSLLSITNASDSNITFTVHSPIRIPYGETTRTYTITNGDVFCGSFDYGTHGMLYVPRGFFSP